MGYDGATYDLPELAWTQRCFSCALVWLWDELLYDREAGRFTPDRLLDEGEREFGGYDGVVLWHAYPVIGIDERNQFDFYRDVPGIHALVADIQARGVRVFVDYNPWDTGTRREGVSDARGGRRVVRELGADGVFLDTMKEARPGARPPLSASVALEGESTVPLARIGDHHLSWAQWFADSAVPGVIRARWFEQRHMLHHTRRWNRDHSDELRSAWLNGVGMLVWENVFGAWVGWNERDRAMLQAHDGGAATARRPADDRRVDAARGAQRRRLGRRLALAARRRRALGAREPRLEPVRRDDRSGRTRGRALAPAARPGGGHLGRRRGDRRRVERVPRAADRTSRCRPAVSVAAVPDGFVRGARRRGRSSPGSGCARPASTARCRTSRSGSRCRRGLHASVEVDRPAPRGPFAIGVREVTDASGAPLTGLTLDEARAHAAAAGARLPTEDEWQLAAEAGLLERVEPLVWNWTESEHSDGRTRFAILKGGAAWKAEGSDWYVDGGPQDPGILASSCCSTGPLERSSQIGFRLAVDL